MGGRFHLPGCPVTWEQVLKCIVRPIHQPCCMPFTLPMSLMGPRGGPCACRCEAGIMIISHLRHIHQDWPPSPVTGYLCVTLFVSACKTTWKFTTGISISFSVFSTIYFPIPTVDAVYLILPTSFWLPISSHRTRWNYHPVLPSLNTSFPCPIHPTCTPIKCEPFNAIK